MTGAGGLGAPCGRAAAVAADSEQRGGSGSPEVQKLALRELRGGSKPHVVLGTMTSVRNGVALPARAEEALASAATMWQVPVLGWDIGSATLADKGAFPLYLRTRPVALQTGGAVAAVLRAFRYRRVLVFLDEDAKATSTLGET